MQDRKLMVEVTDEEYQAIKEGALLVNRGQLLKSITKDELKLVVQYLCKNPKEAVKADIMTGEHIALRTGRIDYANGGYIEFVIKDTWGN